MEALSAIADWRQQLGDRAVITGAEAQQQYGMCTSGVERAIPAALRPCSAEEIPVILEIARRHSVPLYPISTGRNWGYGSANPVIDGCVVLDLCELDRIIDMDRYSGLVTVEPGVTQRQLAEYLARHGYDFMVPVTGGGPNCSLIGNALERGYGITPYADHFGAVTALEAVLADGRIYRSALTELGGSAVDRAFKWGIGPYLDGLFAQGSFGVVTRMTIALAARPERIEAFLFGIREENGLEAAVPTIRGILRCLCGVVGSINLMNSRRVLAMSTLYSEDRVDADGILPVEVITELARRNGVLPWTGIGALYGSDAVVKAARRVVRRLLKPVASRLVFLTPKSSERLARWLGGVPGLRNGRLAARARLLDASMKMMAGHPGEVALPLAYWRSGIPLPRDGMLDPARDGCGLIWYSPLVLMRPDDVRNYVQMVNEVCTAHKVEPLITLTSLSERCFDSSVPLLFDQRDTAQRDRVRACYRALFDAGRSKGYLPYRMSAHAMDWITSSDGFFWEVVGAIKGVLDPADIIAPGRYTRTARGPDTRCREA